ncbi:MAG: hypothetical protein HFI70_14865 [Lachnospiraceae bacterium]|nr:hypothetical protein [Lachnospiraceae bacterium]
MRKDYQNMQKKLLPDKKTQDLIWQNIEKKSSEHRKKHPQMRLAGIAAGITAAMLVLVLLLPQTGIAGGMAKFLQTYFYEQADISQYIVYDIYEDQDEHIKMQIPELLSDGSCLYFNIRYEALDKKGERWLSTMQFDIENIRFACPGNMKYDPDGIRFDDHPDAEKLGNCGTSLDEQETPITSKIRCFTYLYQDLDGDFDLKDVNLKLFYPMPSFEGAGRLMLTSKLDTYTYQLTSDKTISEFYEPTYLKVSKLSFAIFGQNKSVYFHEKDTYSGDSTRINEAFHEELTSIAFLMKDGSRIKISDYGTIKFSAKPDNDPDYNLLIAANYFSRDTINFIKNETIDPEELAGIELNGIYYKLTAQDEGSSSVN